MTKILYNFSENLLMRILLVLLLVFPVLSFKFGYVSPIFPSMEILIIYYFYSLKSIRLEVVFIISMFLDILYFYPIGTLALGFVSASVVLNILARWLTITNYNINCLFFCAYALIIFAAQYIICIISGKQVNDLELVFRYLTTILVYPSLKMLFDKILEYGARQINS
jgi:hypothetical protein